MRTAMCGKGPASMPTNQLLTAFRQQTRWFPPSFPSLTILKLSSPDPCTGLILRTKRPPWEV